MLSSPEYTRAVLADREQLIRDLRRVHQARAARAEARQTESSPRRLIRIRLPQRARA
jgi:hypothetical protein